MHSDSRREKVSLVCVASQTARATMNRYRASSAIRPMSPNSSPTTAKMKSVERSGRNCNCAWLPFIQPLPKTPPEPSAIWLWMM